jgi:hypothetical protein
MLYPVETIKKILPTAICDNSNVGKLLGFHTLAFNDFVTIAQLCKKLNKEVNKDYLSIFLLDLNAPECIENFKKLSYPQQQKVALLYLEAAYPQAKILEDAPDIFLIPFDTKSKPDAFYKLILDFMNQALHAKDVISLILCCHKHKVLTNNQSCELLSNFAQKFLNIEFNPTELNIKNVCLLIKICQYLPYSQNIFNIIWRDYKFANLDERVLLIDSVMESNFYINELDIDLPYNDIIYIMKQIKQANHFSVEHLLKRFLHTHAANLPQEQKLELINIMLERNKKNLLYSLKKFKLNENDILEIYQKAQCTKELITTLKELGWSNQRIFAHFEKYIQSLNPQDNPLYDVDALSLSLEEVLAFSQRNPSWSHILDYWAKENKDTQTSESLNFLLQFRLQTSNYAIKLTYLEYYNCSTPEDIKKMSKYFKKGVEIDENLHKLLDWDFLYERVFKPKMQQDTRGVEQVLVNVNHPGFNKNIGDFIANFSFGEELYLADNRLNKAKEKLDNLYGSLCTNFATLLNDETLKAKLQIVTKKLYAEKIPEEKLFIYMDNAVWFLCLGIRLIQESKLDLIHRAFSQPVVIKTLEQIACIAAPNLRLTLIDIILKLINNPVNLELFGKTLGKAGGYKYIPALIIFANTQNPEKFKSILENIGRDFKNSTTKLQILINGFISIFSANVSDETKFKALEKAFIFNLHYVSQKPNISELKFNSLYIISNNETYGLLSYDLNGQLEDVNDLSNSPKYAELLNLLNLKNSSNEERLAAIYKTGKFANSIKCQLQALMLLQGISALNELDILVNTQEFSQQPWSKNYAGVLQQCFNIPAEKLPFTISMLENFRKPYSLIAYFSKLQSLEEPVYSNMLRDYVYSISSYESSEFYANRYNLEQQPQLSAAVAMSTNPDFLSIWKNTVIKDYDEFHEQVKNNFTSNTVQKIDIQAFLIERIKDFKHLSDIAYHFVHNYLEQETKDGRNSIIEAAKQEVVKISDKGLFKDANIGKLKLQISIMEFIAVENTLSDEQKSFKLASIKTRALLNGEQTFTSDLDVIINTLSNKNKKHNNQANFDKRKLNLINTDHFCHMLLSGTDVFGSCQNVNGNPNLNKHLMATVLSGHIRQLAIIDQETQEIVSRALLKLMIDRTSHRPVLFLERVYPDFGTIEHYNMLVQLAIVTAQNLGCSLTSKSATIESKPYNNGISTVAVRVSEYSDALRGPQTAGYTISDATCLYHHEPKPKSALTFMYGKQAQVETEDAVELKEQQKLNHL